MANKTTLSDLLDRTLWPMGQCARHDIIIRYMGVEHYMATGRMHPLYEKLAAARLATLSRNPTAAYNPERFPRTIKSFRDRQVFQSDTPIIIDSIGRLVEGSHRIACCMFFGITDVWTDTNDRKGGIEHFDWFEKHFTPAELQTVRDKLAELRERFVFSPLDAEAESLEYPPNHQYNVRTLKPHGLLVDRVACLRQHAPEMMEGGESLLDVGSNKGFLSMCLRDRYSCIVGYEPLSRWVDFAERVRRAHGMANVIFRVGALGEITEPADVVYAGHFNHHCYAQEVKTGQPPYTSMHQLADLAQRILVLDGPFTFSDATLAAVANQGKWTPEQRAAFTLDAHTAAISDDFDLVRTGPSGTGPRQIAVYARK